ncbi:thiamine phosphate synthase [Rodentibacter caecimuris]|uniref:Thiamine-phosphate synthase n=1 Tax=Rodentibacter caecimuris TaxID=1796644 RepID=A0ABX3KZT4_9PAST|nr:thiamine-phosphate diphosphorylase [Rodentibacter heylii]
MKYNIKSALHLYFIAGTQDVRHLSGKPEDNLLNVLEQALSCGVSCFQFRDKGHFSLAAQPEKQYCLARQCQDLCHRYHVPFIVNDDVELALEIQADGIHIGQSDEAVSVVVEQIKRKNIFLGLSINNLEQALYYKDHQHIDYFGIGPIFPTLSKPDHSSALGVEFMSVLRASGITKPCVAIGGITYQSAPQLRKLGANGIAVISALTKAKDIYAAVQQLR